MPNAPIRKLKLKGLDSNMDYSITDKKNIFGGDDLMYSGIDIPDLFGDYQSMMWIITRSNK